MLKLQCVGQICPCTQAVQCERSRSADRGSTQPPGLTSCRIIQGWGRVQARVCAARCTLVRPVRQHDSTQFLVITTSLLNSSATEGPLFLRYMDLAAATTHRRRILAVSHNHFQPATTSSQAKLEIHTLYNIAINTVCKLTSAAPQHSQCKAKKEPPLFLNQQIQPTQKIHHKADCAYPTDCSKRCGV
jgi:hypothetical protein